MINDDKTMINDDKTMINDDNLSSHDDKTMITFSWVVIFSSHSFLKISYRPLFLTH